jgi:hypothetical protein
MDVTLCDASVTRRRHFAKAGTNHHHLGCKRLQRCAEVNESLHEHNARHWKHIVLDYLWLTPASASGGSYQSRQKAKGNLTRTNAEDPIIHFVWPLLQYQGLLKRLLHLRTDTWKS